MNVFSQKDSLGSKSPRTIAKYLTSIDDGAAAARFSGIGGAGQALKGHIFGNDQYAYTGILLGYIKPRGSGSLVEIENALTLGPDNSLKGARIKITLDKFYVQSFPGNGTHTVLCEFAGKNQIPGDAEEMRFALTTVANDESSAGLSGAPIFLGVSVGQDGIAFEGRTINVRSETDDKLIEALGSDTFRSGLALLTSAQPALKPFVGLAGSVVKAVVSRNKNCQVYSFKLGLDFAGGTTSARLREGSYVVVQADQTQWKWSDMAWNTSTQAVVQRQNDAPIPFNYMVFGVSRFTGNEAAGKN
jgi:hypothetical protein